MISTALATDLYRLLDKYLVRCLCHSSDGCDHDPFQHDELNKSLRGGVFELLNDFQEDAYLRYWKEKNLWVSRPFHFKSDGTQYTLEEEQEFESTGKCIE